MLFNERRFLGGSPFPVTPVRIRARVTLRMGYEFKQADVCEIHRDGVFLRSGEPWPVGSPVDFELYPLDETVPLVGTGVVDRVDYFAMRIAGVVPRMSVKFVEVGRRKNGWPDRWTHASYLRRMLVDKALSYAEYARYEMMGDRFERDFGEPGAGFRTPIQLIHGYLGTRAVMLPLENRLKKLGYPVFSVRLGTFNWSDIRESAKKIAESTKHLLKKHKLERVDLIGHSMGGLIGLYYAKHLGGAEHLRKMITIGSPFSGTYAALAGIAFFGFAKSSWQLMKGSDFLRELSQGELPEGPRFYSILAKNDELCLPQDATLQGARNYMVPGGHSKLLTGAEAFSYIRAILADREPLPAGTTRDTTAKNGNAA